MGLFDRLPTQKLNLELPGGIRINNICEKVGSVFGKTGRKIGKAVDSVTKNVTIKIDKPKK